MKRYVGVDIGGTFARAGLFYGNRIVEKVEEFTERDGRKAVEQVARMIEVLKQGRSLQGVGVGLPGPLDLHRGIWRSAPNIPHVQNIPALKILEKKLRTKVVIENDAACAALAEAHARNAGEMIYINLGTGVGVGIILGGRIFHTFAGNIEAGHLAVGDGRRCNAGHAGCWEAFASGTAILKMAKEHSLYGDMHFLLEGARKGNKKVLKLFDFAGGYVGRGVASLVNIFRIPLVVLGGSVVEAYPYMKKEIMKELRQRVFDIPKVSLKKLKEPGLVGARMLLGG